MMMGVKNSHNSTIPPADIVEIFLSTTRLDVYLAIHVTIINIIFILTKVQEDPTPAISHPGSIYTF